MVIKTNVVNKLGKIQNTFLIKKKKLERDWGDGVVREPLTQCE